MFLRLLTCYKNGVSSHVFGSFLFICYVCLLHLSQVSLSKSFSESQADRRKQRFTFMILYGRQKCVAEEAPTHCPRGHAFRGPSADESLRDPGSYILLGRLRAALIEMRKARFRHALEFAISLTPWPPHAKS